MPAYRSGKNDAKRRFDPAVTEDMEYTDEEFEFLLAIDQFRQRTGYGFPTVIETLQVLKSLGYEKARPRPMTGPHAMRSVKGPSTFSR
jgi:hypothetical protein